MNTLAIDTSCANFSLAVSRGDRIVRYRNHRGGKRLSSIIISSIRTILAESNMTLKKLDAFVVGLGPGSFTGLRVGLATVKGLSFAAQKPIVGISSLDAVAQSTDIHHHGPVCVLADARRQLVYAAVYEWKKHRLVRRSPYLLNDIHTVLGLCRGTTLFTGEGVKLYKSLIAEKVSAIFASEQSQYPQARDLAMLARERISKGQFDDTGKISPLYLYPEDCQVRR